MEQPFSLYPNCMSCGIVVTPWRRWKVPLEVECCQRCWSKVPVAERLKLVISIRDRTPGGFLSELAELVMRSIEQGPHSLGDDDIPGDEWKKRD